jgi:AmmeMemoRadiSam system protein B/AmmeMemoRadiSam system protein A
MGQQDRHHSVRRAGRWQVLLQKALSGVGPAPRIRQPAVAGIFYPADAAELGKTIDDLLAQAESPPSDISATENLVGIIAPHAGYAYSGLVAAGSYSLLKGRRFERVVVIAPSHFQGFDFASVFDGDAYATPLGQIPIDEAFAAKLANASPFIERSTLGHTPSAVHAEHALEVQLPFLQRVLGTFQLVPIVVGDQSYDVCRALGAALAHLITEENRTGGTLLVASSDLSHHHPYDDAVRIDRKTLRGIEEYDYFDLARNLEMRVWEACGGGPIVAAMIAAERLGATQARVLRYANSGDVTGDHGSVVGYGAVALVKADTDSPGNDEAEFSLSPPEQDALLKIARNAVETAVRESKLYECSTCGLQTLEQERGAFVTLTEEGRLRGCIGFVSAREPLYRAVRDVATLAALQDARFVPVTAGELGSLQYEISVLSPLNRVEDIEEIRIGRHGLLIHQGEHEGLLLPQVATDAKWDRETFLERLCQKAGLPARAWTEPDADLFRFRAVVFGEASERLS